MSWSIAGLRPGMTEGQARGRLGEPLLQVGGVCHWEGTLTICFRDGKILNITGGELQLSGKAKVKQGQWRRRVVRLLGWPLEERRDWDVYTDGSIWLAIKYRADKVCNLMLDCNDPRLWTPEGPRRVLKAPTLPPPPPSPPALAPPPPAVGWTVDGLGVGMPRDEAVMQVGDPSQVYMAPTRAYIVHWVPWSARFGDLMVRLADLAVYAVEGGRQLEWEGQPLLQLGEARAAATEKLGPPQQESESSQLYLLNQDKPAELRLDYQQDLLHALTLHGPPLGPPFEDLPGTPRYAGPGPWLEGWAIQGVSPEMSLEAVWERLGPPSGSAGLPLEAYLVRDTSQTVTYLDYPEGTKVELDMNNLVMSVQGSQLQLLGGDRVLLRAGHLRQDVLTQLGPPDWPSRPFTAAAIYRFGPQELQVAYSRDIVLFFRLQRRQPGPFPPDPPEADLGPGSPVPLRPYPGGRTGKAASPPPRRQGS